MSGLLVLIPVALALGGAGLAAFLWCLNVGQFDDPDGAGVRILSDDDLMARPRRSILERSDRSAPSMDGSVAPPGLADDAAVEQVRAG